MNLVVVSNRVARGKANEPMTGGLAAALLPVVEKSGAIWVGSSGRVRDGANKEPFAEIEALGAGALAMLDLPAAHYGGYYEGFANSALWPALHSRADLIRASQDDYLSYREVNAFMARALLRFRKPDTAFWIQDYHFLALGAELRDLGVTQPVGFFLHTPWPTRAIMGGVPHHRELIEAMLAYDLIGFQTQDDCENFLGYLSSELGLGSRKRRGDVASRHIARRGIPDRHRSRKIRPAGRQGGVASRCVAAAAKPEWREAGDRRRSAGLFQGADQPHQRVRPDVDLAAVTAAYCVVAADRDAFARRDRGLWHPAKRTRQACQRRQRASRRGRLDPDPLSQQGFQPDRAGGPLSHRAGRRGDAAQ